MVGAAIAWALTLIRADIQGGVEVPAVDPELEFFAVSTRPAVNNETNGAQCTVSVSGGALVLDMTGGPGASCDIDTDVRTVGESNRQWVIQDVTFTDVTTEGFVAGSFSTPPVACGLAVDDIGRRVKFRVTVDAGASQGSHPATDAGVDAVNAEDYNDTACPRG